MFAREAVDRELEEELLYHLERELEAGGAHARRAALGLQQRKEECRDMRGINWFDHFSQDLKFALRQLRKTPAFTITSTVVLALGICASVSIFAFVDAALLRPLPYRDPSRLAAVFGSIPLCPQCNLSYPDYQDLSRTNQVFSSMAAYSPQGYLLRTHDGSELATGARVSAAFFRTLGVAPALGRDFTEADHRPGAPLTVILSDEAWRKRYGGRRDAIGEGVTLSGQPYAIIGVLPPGFHFARVGEADFWGPIDTTHGCEANRGCHGIYAIGRLRDGVSLAAAAANVRAIASQLETQYPDTNRGQASSVISLSEALIGNVRPILLVLLCAAGLLLLIAAVNVGSLLLVRSEARKREIALRSGLGASRARLMSQFVTEGLVLMMMGAVAGVAAALFAMRLLHQLIPKPMLSGLPYLAGLGLTPRVMMFAAAVSLVAAAMFTLIPASRLSFSDVRSALAEGGRGTAGSVWRHLGSHLVVLELATAVVLLAGAGLLTQSLYHVLNVDLGMRPDHLATLRVSAARRNYTGNGQVVALQRRITVRVASIPGVQSVALTSMLPVVGGNTVWIKVEGHPFHGEHNEVAFRNVTAAYFKTIGARLTRGRYFREDEDDSKPPVVILDESFVRKYLPNEDPLGKRIAYFSNNAPAMEIVGVVADIKEGALDKNTWPTMYIPFNQQPNTTFSLVARTAQPEESLLTIIAAAVREVDGGITTSDARSMSKRIDESPAAYLRSSAALLVGGFAVLALLLSGIGLYGVIAYSVGQRTREIGVRIALGAQRGAVYRLIFSESCRLMALGVAMGAPLAILAASFMADLLFGVRTWDLPTLAAVAVALALCGLAASWAPARRAASVNPIDALRSE